MDTHSRVEEKCEVAILALGFERVGDCGEWRSCYYNKEKEVFLRVYVDDFKMSGPTEAVKEMWKAFVSLPDGKSIDLGAPAPVGALPGMSAWRVRSRDLAA